VRGSRREDQRRLHMEGEALRMKEGKGDQDRRQEELQRD
jgi:hypothetical protein